MLPPRKPKRSNRDNRWRSQSHCNFVRSHACCACGTMDHIEVAHVRRGSDGGISRKPSDYYTISLCQDCHALQHRIGEQSFEARFGIDMQHLARAFATAPDNPARGKICQAMIERGHG